MARRRRVFLIGASVLAAMLALSILVGLPRKIKLRKTQEVIAAIWQSYAAECSVPLDAGRVIAICDADGIYHFKAVRGIVSHEVILGTGTMDSRTLDITGTSIGSAGPPDIAEPGEYALCVTPVEDPQRPLSQKEKTRRVANLRGILDDSALASVMASDGLLALEQYVIFHYIDEHKWFDEGERHPVMFIDRWGKPNDHYWSYIIYWTPAGTPFAGVINTETLETKVFDTD